jgi:hypothetical protein
MLNGALARPGAARALSGLVAAVLGSSCGETLKDTYTVQIAGPNDAFAGAATVELLVSGQIMASKAVTGTGPFDLEIPDLDPTTTRTAILGIRGLDAAGKVVAFGQTPQLEVLKLSPTIRIFVQKPGTLVRGRDLNIKTRDHVAVPAESAAFSPELSVAVTVPIFGAGRMTVPAGGGTEQELLSNDLFVYNPLTHSQQDLGVTAGGLRAEASAIARGNLVYVFGGLSQVNIQEPPKTTAQLDLFGVGREGFASFFLQSVPPYDGGMALARKRTVLAASVRPVFAFGGLDGNDQPLDTVIVIDPDVRPQTPVALSPAKMVTPRAGHTATTVSTSEPWGNILIYGGAAAGQPVAELFEPMKEQWLPLDLSAAEGQPGHPGTFRRDHIALNLPTSTEARVLILGGTGEDGKARGDSLIYYPAQRSFGPGPLTLKRPRTRFVAFVSNDDLVVTGGYDQDQGGKLVETAEIYDIKTWALLSETPAVPRARATVTALPNLSVVILGGETAGSSSNAVEIYQPRR